MCSAVSNSLQPPWTVARQTPLSVGFSRRDQWSELPFSIPGDLPDPGIKSTSPTLQAGSLPLSHQGNPSFEKKSILFVLEQRWYLRTSTQNVATQKQEEH